MPEGVGEMAGYAGLAFLVGIVIHSLFPYDAAPAWIVIAAFGLTAVACGVFLEERSGSRPPFKQVTLIILVSLIAVVLGVLRFDMARRQMPSGLIPLDANGLVHSVAFSRPTDPHDIRYWLGIGRAWVRARASVAYPTDQAALLAGIWYGDRSLAKPIQAQFRRAGLIHVIAVSGENVTIVVVIVMTILLGCRLPRRLAFAVLTVAIILFVLFVDPSASVVRAAIMGWLVELAPVVGRIPRTSRLLLVAAVAFTFWQPWALMFDAGFALSFLAMWGLLTFGRWLQETLKPMTDQTMLVEIISSTVGATLMTTPYSAWAFGNATAFGLLTNMLALPIVPWAMGFGAVGLAFPRVWWLALPGKGFLDVLLWIAQIPDLVPFGYWSHLSPSLYMCAGSYAVLFAIWRLMKRKKRVVHRKPRKKEEKMSEKNGCRKVLTDDTVCHSERSEESQSETE